MSQARLGAGRISTLILPADTAWGAAGQDAEPLKIVDRSHVSSDIVRKTAAVLESEGETLIHITGRALREDTLEMLGKIQSKTGCRLSCMTANSRWQRGAGRVAVERIEYPIDIAIKQLSSVKDIILLGAQVPVAFFAYPNKPSKLIPLDCNVHELASIDHDHYAVLAALVDELDANCAVPKTQQLKIPEPMSGALTPNSIASAIGHFMPENAIVIDESVTTGRGFSPFTIGAKPHDWLSVTGGSIGLGMPMATGAALACPERKVICTEGDGSGMYTLQALWTQARENCDVVNIIFNNGKYAILKGEFTNVGVQNPGRKALDMLELSRPNIDWCSLAKGMGVPAMRATDTNEFNNHLASAVSTPGPHLLEVMLK